MNIHCLKVALRTTIPVFLGYISCGIAFGLITINAGYPWWLAPAMGILMFAGAGQFFAIPLFAAGTPIPLILATELLLNIRHIVYGLPLINQFKECRRSKPYLIYALTDETFSILTTTNVPPGVKPEEYFFTVSILDQAYWVGGSLIGAVAGAMIHFDFTGVDFALTALFAVLSIDQIQKFVRERKDRVTAGDTQTMVGEDENAGI
jgi:4-azaleucine resistance transporter AzlC